MWFRRVLGDPVGTLTVKALREVCGAVPHGLPLAHGSDGVRPLPDPPSPMAAPS